MEFNIFEYIVYNPYEESKEVTLGPNAVDVRVLYWIIVHYEEDRGLLNEEYLYDTYNEEDFINVVRMYGIDVAIDIYEHGRFCYGGNAHPKPMVVNRQDLEKFIKDNIDLEYFKELYIKSDTIEGWADIVDTKEIMRDWGPQITNEVTDREMRFGLELEVFYTAKHRYGIKITDAETRWNKNLIADTKEELATKLMDEIDGYYGMLDDLAKNEEEE